MKTSVGLEQQTAVAKRAAAIAAAREIMSLQKYCALITIDACG